MFVNLVSRITEALMRFPFVSLWLSLDRCPLAASVNYGCGGVGLIPVLMCTDRWPCWDVNNCPAIPPSLTGRWTHSQDKGIAPCALPLATAQSTTNNARTETSPDKNKIAFGLRNSRQQFVPGGSKATWCVLIQSIHPQLTKIPPWSTATEVLKAMKTLQHKSRFKMHRLWNTLSMKSFKVFILYK